MRRWVGRSTAIALAMLLLAASSADAKIFVVNPEIADGPVSSNPCTEPCSLRQAIFDANGSIEKENRVEVPPGTYTLTRGPLEVDPHKETTELIFGLAPRAGEVVISGNEQVEVMSVGSAAGGPSGEAVLALVEITGGHFQGAGGGIQVYAQTKLNLINASVDANTSQEVGGGIYVAGELDVVDSVIARNTALGRGGGIDSIGPVTLVNSTIANNTTSGEGGGVYEEAGLKLASATIAGNKAKAGGGLAGGHAVEAFDSLLAQNKPENCAVKIEDAPLGHNLADDASCRLSSSGDKETGAGLAGLVQEGGLPLLANNGGPTETIALQSSSPAVGAGDSEVCPTLDQRGEERPKGLCDIGAFQLSKKPTSSGGGEQTSQSSTPSAGAPPPPPPSPPPLPPPVLARTGDVAPVSGTVRVKLPGTDAFVALSSLREVPFGTVIDATHGHVVVTTAGPHGATQTGEFFEGEFVLTQGRNGVVTATLAGGDFAVCPTARERAHIASAHAAHASGSHVVRKLWANAHGSFSTKGNYAAGAVAGTEWLTEDLCDGTSIRVTRDKVLVTNLVNRHHLIVKSGHRYLAKAP